MSLLLTPHEEIARIQSNIRIGIPIILRDNDMSWLVITPEGLTQSRFEALRDLGNPEIVITDWRAKTLATWAAAGDLTRIAIPKDRDNTWVNAIADPSMDLNLPLKGPFNLLDGKNIHAHRIAITLMKSAHLLPAAVMVPLSGSLPSQFTSMDIQNIDLTLFSSALQLDKITVANVPLSVHKDSRVHVFRPRDGSQEHYAIEIGNPNRKAPVLSRLHSACFTGDLIGSLKCDCGAQLQSALRAIGENGAGMLIYMNQEGRGIGLANKLRAYALQDQGFDTVDANHRLGFEDDERNFILGAKILQTLGFNQIRLMTNNPNKVNAMKKAGLIVTERVPLQVGKNPLNSTYLSTKANKSGHFL